MMQSMRALRKKNFLFFSEFLSSLCALSVIPSTHQRHKIEAIEGKHKDIFRHSPKTSFQLSDSTK